MIDAVGTMLRMQDRMNTRVHPQWMTQDFAWHRAIWVECAELIDHWGYKWWKHHAHDLGQVQLEVVDIWHFGLSARFEAGRSIEDIAAGIVAEWPRAPETHGVVEAAEALAGVAAAQARFSIPAFASLLAAAQLDFPSLYRQYLGKNVLNFFRQDNGYQDGSYRKQWAGREDNEHLVELLVDIDTDASDAERQLYAALDARYRASA